MDLLVRRLQLKLQQHPDNQILQQTLTRLSAAGRSTLDDGTRNAVVRDLEGLMADGVLDADDVRIFQELQGDSSRSTSGSVLPTRHAQNTSHDRYGLPSTSQHDAERFRYIQANLADTTVPLASFLPGTSTYLPVELVELLNQTYFLHILATEPDKALPPGKSLLSVLSRPREAAQSEKSALEEQVETMVHAAFWEEAYESLSNPIPSVQLTRLKSLYRDLHTALSALLPADNNVLVTLSFHLSPTSAPLRSAILHMREILLSLGERCAPHHDERIRTLMQQLDVTPSADLAKVVVEVVKAILKLADEMKDDLSQFVLGNMGEDQLHHIISAQAASREREVVGHLWPPPRFQQLWTKWLNEADIPRSPGPRSVHKRFVHRLMQAVGTNTAVHYELPVVSVTRVEDTDASPPSPLPQQSASHNVLPPPLLFVQPALVILQNYLQALVIAASLRALVRIPPPLPPVSEDVSSEQTLERTFVGRVWTLLKAEIEGEPGADNTKVVNLADEVVRVRRTYGGAASPDEENKLRIAVDRTLQVRDPVFQLLQRRLVRAITERLVAMDTEHDALNHAAPVRLRAGRTAGRAKKPSFMIDLGIAASRHKASINAHALNIDSVPPLVVKGFEDPVLVSAIKDVVARLGGCIEWTERVWTDLFDEDATAAVDQ